MVAVADDKALALTGSLRGEVWVVRDPPGDGFWIVEQIVEFSYKEARWKSWVRPSEQEVLAYQRFVEEMG